MPFSDIFPASPPPTFGMKLHTPGTFPIRKYGEGRGKKPEDVGSSYTFEEILHPILHPKFSDFTGIFLDGCRKCRRFSKNFFSGRECERSGSTETSDSYEGESRCLALKVRMSCAKKSGRVVNRDCPVS